MLKEILQFLPVLQHRPPPPKKNTYNDKPKFSDPLRDSSPLILPGRSEGIQTYSAFPGLKKNWAQVLITESRHGFPRCPPRRGADPTSSHDIPPRGVPTPLGPLHPIPRCWPAGARSPNSGDWAQETLRGTGSQIRARAQGHGVGPAGSGVLLPLLPRNRRLPARTLDR